MLKSKYKRMLVISFCVVFTIISAMTGVLLEDVVHTENCNIPNCSFCTIINILTDFMKNIKLINIEFLILIAIVPLMQLINQNIQKERKLTLIELKVIQNK